MPFSVDPALPCPKAVSHLLLSECESSPFTKQETSTTAGEELQILAVIQASLPITADEAILWDVRVPDTDVMVITEVTSSSLWQPREAMPQSSRSHMVTLAPHCITPKFLHPLALPAECVSATEEDLMLETKGSTVPLRAQKVGLMRSSPSLRFPRHESKPHTADCLQGSGSDDHIILNGTSHFWAGSKASH